MLELPEVLARAAELRENVVEKTVDKVLPPSKAHKFCWYSGEPEMYHAALAGKKVTEKLSVVNRFYGWLCTFLYGGDVWRHLSA